MRRGCSLLQFDARPSMRSFTSDVYRDEVGGGHGAFLAQSAEISYAGGMHLFPSDDPIELGGQRLTPAPLEPTDVVMARDWC